MVRRLRPFDIRPEAVGSSNNGAADVRATRTLTGIRLSGIVFQRVSMKAPCWPTGQSERRTSCAISEGCMKLTFDPETDEAFLRTGGDTAIGGAPRSEACDLGIDGVSFILLYTEDGRLAGIEVLGASRFFSPGLLHEATRV